MSDFKILDEIRLISPEAVIRDIDDILDDIYYWDKNIQPTTNDRVSFYLGSKHFCYVNGTIEDILSAFKNETKKRLDEHRKGVREEKITKFLSLSEKQKIRLHPCEKKSIFFDYKNVEKLPDRSGCYAIIRIHDDHVYYVGATKSLKKRLYQHLGVRYMPWSKESKKGCKVYYWLEKRPFILERNLIRFLAPSVNTHFSHEFFIESHQWDKRYNRW